MADSVPEVTSPEGPDFKLHPRLRTMLNMKLGPITLLAETQATVRIPRTTLSDDELQELYPCARTVADPRSDTPSKVNMVTVAEMAELDKQPPSVRPSVAKKAAPDKKKDLSDSPKMGKTVPPAEFSVFVEIDADSKDEIATSHRDAAVADVDVSVVDDVMDLTSDPKTATRRGGLFAMTVTAESVVELAKHPGVASVESGETIRKLDTTANGGARRPTLADREIPGRRDHHDGTGVLIGIIDVEGFDFSHPDFLNDDGTTRFLALWDQAAEQADGFRASPHTNRPSRFRTDYGAEILKSHMDAALESSPNVGVSATDLEPQTSMIRGSHGTHVASIAAGKRGIARAAGIVGVTIGLGAGDTDRRRSFYDTSRLTHAVDYILDFASHLATERNEPVPVSINISLGTNGHSHDGSAVVNRWIDYAVATPGRAVTVAGGNAGQTEESPTGGIGHLLGRIHAQGRIASRELRQEISWQVFGNGLADLSMNELEIWYPAQDRIAVSLTAPDGEVIPAVSPGEQVLNHARPDMTRVAIFNDQYHPVNGFNRISIYLEPYLGSNNSGDTAVVGVPAGTWTVQLIGEEIRDGTWNAWIERDDPQIIGDLDGVTYAFFPSAFAAGSFQPGMQISTLACGAFVNGVANIDVAAHAVNPSSSRGPTRTGAPKPDIGAPGTDIVAAEGFSGGDHWVSMTGTSMASPYVTGVIGLMLAVDHRLTATQITSILRRTASPLPGHTFEWQDDAGFGEINAAAAIEETAKFKKARRQS